MAHAQSATRRRRVQLLKLANHRGSDSRIKTGRILTKSDGISKSIALELIEKNGWSLDVGLTHSTSFMGISKDVLDTGAIELDIGAGMTLEKDPYIGFHMKF